MTTEEQLREFMSRVVPWPGSVAEPGWINLHWRCPATEDRSKSYWAGKPVKTLDQFVDVLGWAMRRRETQDIYFCTSLQAEVTTSAKGKVKVKRSKPGAIALKAIWLDVDVKEEPKGYPTLPVAIKAVGQFVTDAGLPPPSALVATGGGLHVYWISDRSLTPDQWQPYAEGLKALALKHNLRCDAGLTTDSARILRVPGTFNHKQRPLRPVRILGLKHQENDYDFASSLSHIAISGNHIPAYAAASAFGGARPSTAFAALTPESLSAGIEREEFPPLAWVPVAQGCAFIRDALKTGGKDYSQPMWNLTTLAATFMENGHALAHKMGKAHPGYSPESTEALWERKNRERKDRGLGWPSCSAIQASGCAACAACPHFQKIKSPLNLSKPIPKAKEAGSIATPGEAGNMHLPRGYFLNDGGYICKLDNSKGKDGEDGEPKVTQIFHNKVSRPLLHYPSELSFDITEDLGRQSRIHIKLSDMHSSVTMWGSLLGQGLMPYLNHRKNAEDFLMSWISELQKVKKALDTVPFGWHYDADGHCTGFSYGDVLMMKGGGDLPVGTGDQTIRRLYRPTGRIEPWIAGCKMITDQGRPALEAVVAASFGAPLMMAAGEYSGVLSAWGESGIGKSSAVKVGMAVWGHPKLGKETQITTAKSALQKMGELKNLPLYWDEISNPAIQKHLFVAMDNATQGVEGGRLRSDTTQRSRGDWQTLVIACANLNFVDYVTAHQASTDAGVYRVFEIKVDEPTGAAGRLHTVDASAITADLERNYGRMGLAYSRMLADDPDKITEYVKDVVKQIGKEVGQTEPERFWAAVAGTTLAGAKLANELGASFNIEPLHKFLVEQYLENRRRNSSEATKGGGKDNTEDVLTNWLRDQSNTTLFTDKFWQGHGKPSGVTALFGPRIDLNKGITTQWSLDDKTLRISRTKLNSYLNENKISPSHVRDGLVKFFGASVTKASLGIGTNYVQGREHVYVIPVKEGTSLWNIMHAHKSPMEPKLAVQANADAGASQSA